MLWIEVNLGNKTDYEEWGQRVRAIYFEVPERQSLDTGKGQLRLEPQTCCCLDFGCLLAGKQVDNIVLRGIRVAILKQEYLVYTMLLKH